MFDAMWKAVPWWPGGLAVSLAVTVLLARPLSRRLRSHPLVTAGWVLAVGLVLTVTLTPGIVAAGDPSLIFFRAGNGWCALSPLSPLRPGELVAFNRRTAQYAWHAKR